MNDVSSKFTTTINRFKRNSKNKPSLFSQVNTLKEYGINSLKEIPHSFIEEETDEKFLLADNSEELDGVFIND